MLVAGVALLVEVVQQDWASGQESRLFFHEAATTSAKTILTHRGSGLEVLIAEAPHGRFAPRVGACGILRQSMRLSSLLALEDVFNELQEGALQVSQLLQLAQPALVVRVPLHQGPHSTWKGHHSKPRVEAVEDLQEPPLLLRFSEVVAELQVDRLKHLHAMMPAATERDHARAGKDLDEVIRVTAARPRLRIGMSLRHTSHPSGSLQGLSSRRSQPPVGPFRGPQHSSSDIGATQPSIALSYS